MQEYPKRSIQEKYFTNLHYCNICPYFTTSIFFLVKHVQDHGSSAHFNCENSTIENYYCKDCDFETDLIVSLKEHGKNNYDPKADKQQDLPVEYNVQSYICTNCNFNTRYSMKYLQHSLTCDQTHKMKFHIKEALDYVRQDHWYKCVQCNYKTKSKHGLKIHNNLKHFKDYALCTYQRKKCLYSTKFKRSFLTHMCNHYMPEALYEWCSWEHNYSKHPSEGKIEWYHCGICPYKTSLLCSLQMHMNSVHTEHKYPHKCEQCVYRTRNRANLNDHIITTHLNENEIKWYQCGECLYKFKLAKHLKQHLSTVHLEGRSALYKCGHCSFITKYPDYLEEHLSHKHPAVK